MIGLLSPATVDTGGTAKKQHQHCFFSIPALPPPDNPGERRLEGEDTFRHSEMKNRGGRRPVLWRKKRPPADISSSKRSHFMKINVFHSLLMAFRTLYKKKNGLILYLLYATRAQLQKPLLLYHDFFIVQMVQQIVFQCAF